MKIQLHLKLLNNSNGKVFKLKCNRTLDKQLKKIVEIWYKNFVDRSYRGPRPRRDKTVKKIWLVLYWRMLSLWRRRGRQDGVALGYVLSTEKPPSYGSCSDDEGGLQTARGPRSWLVERLLATWWRFVAGVELPPIVFRRPARVHVYFNMRYRLHPKGEKMLSQISYQTERGE
jgi:hypothetical protein